MRAYLYTRFWLFHLSRYSLHTVLCVYVSPKQLINRDYNTNMQSQGFAQAPASVHWGLSRGFSCPNRSITMVYCINTNLRVQQIEMPQLVYWLSLHTSTFNLQCFNRIKFCSIVSLLNVFLGVLQLLFYLRIICVDDYFKG